MQSHRCRLSRGLLRGSSLWTADPQSADWPVNEWRPRGRTYGSPGIKDASADASGAGPGLVHQRLGITEDNSDTRQSEGREVVIVEAVRTPIGRGHKEKGHYKDTTLTRFWRRPTPR